jgi:hypothetical protein
MVSKFQKEWQDAEREYEKDTKYGTELGKQDAASDRIAADLEAMSAYKRWEPPISWTRHSSAALQEALEFHFEPPQATRAPKP